MKKLTLSLIVMTSLMLMMIGGVSATDGDVTIIVQDQADNPIESATASLLFYVTGSDKMESKLTNSNGIATFTAEEIATFLLGYDTTVQIHIQPGAKFASDGAYGKVRTVDPTDGFPIIPYNNPGGSLEVKPAMSFDYNMIMMSTEPVQTVWNDLGNEFTVTVTLADDISGITPFATRLRLIRNLVGGQPPAVDPDDDWYMWNGAGYEKWKGIATVDATVTGGSVSTTFSQDIFSDWLVGNKIVVRPEIWISRDVGGVPTVDDYNAVDILRPSSYVHPVQINEEDLFYPTIQDAIDAATAGDTINVAAGTYAENIVIENKDNIIIDGSVGSTVEPTSGIGFEIRNSDDITITGFTINTFGLDAHGIYVSTSASANLNIIDNVININGQSTGIYTKQVSPAHGGWTISGNTISAPNAGVNIELYDVNDVTVSGNTFEESGSVSFVYSSELSDVSGLILTDNTFFGNGDDAWPGVIPTVWIESDFITFDGDTVVDDVTISGNTFNDWTNTAILIGEDGCCSEVTGVVINQNKFLKTSPTSTLESYILEEVNAEYNWWGTIVESEIQVLTNQGVGTVDYDPWCLNDECTNLGGEGVDFIALSVPYFIDYLGLYGFSGFKSQDVSIELKNVGSLNVTVTPYLVVENSDPVFEYINFKDDVGSGLIGVFSTIIPMFATQPEYPPVFSNPKSLTTWIKLTQGLGKLVGPQTGTIYFQAVEV